MKSERGFLAKLDNRADDPTVRDANGEWIKAGQKGTKREQCCPVLFSVCCVRPPTRNHSVHPPLIYPGILQRRAHNFRVLMRRSSWWWQLPIFVFRFPSARSTPFMFTVLRESHFLLWQIIYFCDRLSEIFQTHQKIMPADAVTRRNCNGGIIDYTKNRYRRIRGDQEFMRRYGSAANGFTYPFITELVGVKFGYRVLTRQLT